MSEQLVGKPPASEIPDTALDKMKRNFGQIAMAAVGFHGGEKHFLGKDNNGEYRSIVLPSNGAGEKVGSGMSAQEAMSQTLEGMRSLERIDTKPLLRIDIDAEKFADFTPLQHYNPKVAPNTEAYPVPDYLQEAIKDEENGRDTYDKTVEVEDWQKQILGIAKEYIGTEKGQQLASQLNVNTIESLTPEQAIKFSIGFVQDVSAYSDDATGRDSQHDNSTTMDLLREGMRHKGDPEWQGNGVCRNVASNVKAVFEAIKENQQDLSMLRNTYVIYDGGSEGAGYDDSRPDYTSSSVHKTGHAWNRFVTIDEKGSSSTTIIDATWALDKDITDAMQHFDRTPDRTLKASQEMFSISSEKAKSFADLTGFYEQSIAALSKKERSKTTALKTEEFVATRFIQSAGLVLTEMTKTENPDESVLNFPASLAAAIYRMRDKLGRGEVATVFELNERSGKLRDSQIKGIVKSFAETKNINPATKFVFEDETLQQKVLDAMEPDQLKKVCAISGKLRAKTRQSKPEMFEAFDPEASLADARELEFLAEKAGVKGEVSPARTLKKFHSKLMEAAGSTDQYQAIVAGRTDYDLLVDYENILKMNVNSKTEEN